jgi:transposase
VPRAPGETPQRRKAGCEEEALNYIGIDVSKGFHVAAVRRDTGAAVGEAIEFANDEAGFSELARQLAARGCDPSTDLVAMESTGHYWLVLWSHLAERGWRLSLINPLQTDAFRKANTVRKTKTDKVDAMLIADFARFKALGPSAMSPEDVDGLKQLTRYRTHVVQERTGLMNRATALADRLFPELAGMFGGVKPKAFRAVLRELGTPAEIASTNVRTVERVLREASGGAFGHERAEELKSLAKGSVGVRFASGAFSFELAHVIDLIDRLDREVAEVEAECAAILERTPGAVLTSVPGIGTVTAASLAAEIGDPNRFDDPSKLFAFAGMDAAVKQSGKPNVAEVHMSKRGSSYLRYTLMQAADNVRRFDPYFGDYYDAARARGKHHYVALSGVARKLCGVVLALMKEQRPYERRPSIQSSQAEGDAS